MMVPAPSPAWSESLSPLCVYYSIHWQLTKLHLLTVCVCTCTIVYKVWACTIIVPFLKLAFDSFNMLMSVGSHNTVCLSHSLCAHVSSKCKEITDCVPLVIYTLYVTPTTCLDPSVFIIHSTHTRLCWHVWVCSLPRYSSLLQENFASRQWL